MPLPHRADAAPAYPEYEGLRTQAAGRSRFVDRSDLDRMEATTRRRGTWWCSAVLGYAFPGLRSISTLDANLLLAADAAGIDPPLPPDLAQAFAEDQRARETRANAEQSAAQAAAAAAAEREQRWAALRHALPVAVEVRHNYTSHRHLENYTQGGDHIYLLDDLDVGRLHRPAAQVLCFTPSRARDLAEFPEPAGDGRLPNCRACWNTAERIAAALGRSA